MTVNPNLRILYDNDGFTYRFTMHKVQFGDSRPDQFEIKLANDGFIYQSSNHLEGNTTYDSSRHYHNTFGWSQLSNNAFMTHFGVLVVFSKSFLQMNAVEGQILYNKHEECIDLCFSKANPTQDMICLLVTFKPGYPEHFNENDHWGRI